MDCKGEWATAFWSGRAGNERWTAVRRWKSRYSRQRWKSHPTMQQPPSAQWYRSHWLSSVVLEIRLLDYIDHDQTASTTSCPSCLRPPAPLQFFSTYSETLASWITLYSNPPFSLAPSRANRTVLACLVNLLWTRSQGERNPIQDSLGCSLESVTVGESIWLDRSWSCEHTLAFSSRYTSLYG